MRNASDNIGSDLSIPDPWWQIAWGFTVASYFSVSKIAANGGTGVAAAGMSLLKKQLIPPFTHASLVIVWMWNTSYTDTPFQSVRDSYDELNGTCNSSLQTAKMMLGMFWWHVY